MTSPKRTPRLPKLGSLFYYLNLFSNVDDASDRDEKNRRSRVAETAVNRRDDVAADDERETASANEEILTRKVDRFRRRSHRGDEEIGSEND